jgi:hypothetical protein
MPAAQTAPVGLKQPLKGSLKSVPRSHRSEIDRFAARTATGEKPEDSHHDHWASGLTAWDGISEYAGRLASRAAFNCSGVRTSGSDTLTRSLARCTWRLWRFAILLSIGRA